MVSLKIKSSTAENAPRAVKKPTSGFPVNFENTTTIPRTQTRIIKT
jgi:hypothetical protein